MNANTSNGKPPGMFDRFMHSEVSGSIVLLVSTIVALVWANSPWADVYDNLTHTYIGVSWGEQVFKMSLGHWIGDGLMVIFFFVVGLEIKREIVIGQLSSPRRAILPVGAALGGMIVPALAYLAFNAGGDGVSGWGIPMATDIAFALGVLALFGKRVPIGLKVFLTALAIADDLGAVMVIAIFYTEQIVISGLVAAAIFMVLIAVAGHLGIRRSGIYIILAVGAWAGVLVSGVHATIAGVLVAMLVPVRATIDPKAYLKAAKENLAALESSELTKDSMVHDKQQMKALDNLYLATEDMRPAGISLEHHLHPIQAFLILPLFALFKAGVRLDGDAISQIGPVGIGIILGLVVGKQIGICSFSWLAVRAGWADLPAGVTWKQIWGASILAGIGFTMSIFISELAFKSPEIIAQAKVAILIASVIAAVVGYVVLKIALPRRDAGAEG